MDEVIQKALLDAGVMVECKLWLRGDPTPEEEAELRLHQQYRPAFGDRDVCSHCTVGMDLAYWPCPTIQAINDPT